MFVSQCYSVQQGFSEGLEEFFMDRCSTETVLEGEFKAKHTLIQVIQGVCFINPSRALCPSLPESLLVVPIATPTATPCGIPCSNSSSKLLPIRTYGIAKTPGTFE